MIYVGSTCQELETRLIWHKQIKSSQVFKYRNNKSEIKLIVNSPCKDRKELERVETEFIREYSIKYGGKLLNKRCNPLCKKQKEVKHHFEIEDDDKLRLRAGLGKKIKTKEYDSMFKIGSIVKGMRMQTPSKFIEQNIEICI